MDGGNGITSRAKAIGKNMHVFIPAQLIKKQVDRQGLTIVNDYKALQNYLS